MGRLTRIFVAGLLASLPLLVTAGITAWLINFIGGYAGPNSWFGQQLIALGIGFGASSYAPYVVGVGLVAAAIFLLGLLVETHLWSFFSGLIESVLRRIPLVSNVYDLSKRFVGLVDSKGGDNLKGMSAVWCFFGGEPGAAVLALLPSPKPVRLGATDYFGILVPSAPVPVGGGLIYVPAAWIRPADIGVDQLINVYVSMGVTPPVRSA